MRKAINTIVRALADLVEFDAAIVSAHQSGALKPIVAKRALEQRATFAERVRKAYEASTRGDYSLARDLPWHDAAAEVEARRASRRRMIAQRRAAAEFEAELATITA